MKINKLFTGLTIMAALGLAACSSDEESPEEEAGNVHFLSVNIAQADMTRAPEDASGNYENGSEEENKVTKIRFYFFHDDGTAALVKMPVKANYYDWESPTGTGTNAPNVERTLNATIVINTSGTGDSKSELPSQILAVLNPTDALLGQGNLDLADLRKKVENYAILANKVPGKRTFVMASSVYEKSGVVATTKISPTDYYTSSTNAEQHPVIMYVERNVAKVRLSYDGITPNTDGAIALKTASDENFMVTPYGGTATQVYFKVNGWSVTANTCYSYLSKNISESWPDNLFGSTYKWNYSPFFRSYWAINPESGDKILGGGGTTVDDNQFYYPYKSSAASGLKIGETPNSMYTSENAAINTSGKSRTYPSQVIVCGQLCTADGTPMELAQYGGVYYADEAAVINAMVPQVNLWKADKSHIAAADLALESALQHEMPGVTKSQETNGRYWMYLKLKSAGTWYKDADATAVATDAEVKAALTNAGHAKVWKNGQTYYWFKIQHLGESTGKFGVVRNHIYDCKITNIVGLGTPVDPTDPDEPIYPEDPKDDDSYLAAKINILSWRIVSNSYTLGQ